MVRLYMQSNYLAIERRTIYRQLDAESSYVNNDV